MSSFEALRADVVWNVDLGRSTPEVEAFRDRFLTATKETSDATLRLAGVQGRLDQALARHGPNSRQAAAALLALRREEAALAAESERSGSVVASAHRRSITAIEQEERSLGRLVRGSVAGSGVLRGLGRSVAFASSTFLGGFGLVYAVESTIRKAGELQAQLALTQHAVALTGLSWKDYGKDIEETVRREAQLSGFDDTELLRTFSRVLRATGDVGQSYRLMALAADVARGANIPLETAAKLVTRAAEGQARGLAALGISAQKGATGLELIDKITQKYGGDAVKFGDTAAGAQARFRVALNETEAAIGQGVLPELTRLLNEGTDYLNHLEKTGRLQHDAATAAHDLGVAIHYAGDAFNFAKGLIHDVDSVTGSFTNTVKLLLLLKLASVVRGWAGSLTAFGNQGRTAFGRVAQASNDATLVVQTDAGKMKLALQGVVLEEGAAASGFGKFGRGLFGKQGALGGLGLLSLFAGGATGSSDLSNLGNAGLIAALGNPEIAAAYLLFTERGRIQSGADWISTHIFGQPSSAGFDRLLKLVKAIGSADEQQLTAIENVIASGSLQFKGDEIKVLRDAIRKRRGQLDRGIGSDSTRGGGFHAHPHRGDTSTSATRNAPYQPTSREQIDRALALTEGQTGQARLDALKAEAAYDDKYIAIQKKLLANSKTKAEYEQHLATLQRLEQEKRSAESEISSISSAATRRDKTAADKRQREYAQGVKETEQRLQEQVRRARTPAGKERAQDALTEFLKREEHDMKLTRAQRDGYRQALRREQDAATKAVAKELADARAAKEQELKNAVARAQIAVEKATKGTPEYAKAIAAEEKALAAEVAYYASLERVDKGRRKAQDEAHRLAVEKELAKLKKSTTPATADLAKAEYAFLQSLHGFDTQYASNVIPENGRPINVELHQHFPHPPTRDGNREAIYARRALTHAMQTV